MERIVAVAAADEELPVAVAGGETFHVEQLASLLRVREDLLGDLIDVAGVGCLILLLLELLNALLHSP